MKILTVRNERKSLSLITLFETCSADLFLTLELYNGGDDFNGIPSYVLIAHVCFARHSYEFHLCYITLYISCLIFFSGHIILILVFFLNDLGLFQNMTSRLPRNVKKSASKRNRSEDSQRSSTPVSVRQTSRNLEAHERNPVPAFLRQSKFGKLPIFSNHTS